MNNIETIKFYNRTEHYLNKRSHRGNGPAVLYDDGEEAWLFNGRFHRYYGSQNNYAGSWWIHGTWVKNVHST